MPSPKSTFRLGHSPISGHVYAGLVRGNMFVGKKHDVTDSFLETMLVWATAAVPNGARTALVGGDDGHLYEVRVRVKRIRVRPAKEKP